MRRLRRLGFAILGLGLLGADASAGRLRKTLASSGIVFSATSVAGMGGSLELAGLAATVTTTLLWAANHFGNGNKPRDNHDNFAKSDGGGRPGSAGNLHKPKKNPWGNGDDHDGSLLNWLNPFRSQNPREPLLAH